MTTMPTPAHTPCAFCQHNVDPAAQAAYRSRDGSIVLCSKSCEERFLSDTEDDATDSEGSKDDDSGQASKKCDGCGKKDAVEGQEFTYHGDTFKFCSDDCYSNKHDSVYYDGD